MTTGAYVGPIPSPVVTVSLRRDNAADTPRVEISPHANYQSQKGATRLLNRYSGKELRIVRNDRKTPARIDGRNVLWDDCVQRVLEGRDTVAIRLFGGIYERNGRFKIFSYSNDL